MAEAPAVRVDFSINDRMSAVVAFVQRLAALAGAPPDEPACIDLARCTYLGPDGAAVLAAVVHDLRTRDRQVRVISPAGPKALQGFWRCSGLESAVGSPPTVSGTADTRNPSVVPIQQLRTAGFRDADPIIKLVEAHRPISEDTAESLRICVNEVVQNVQDHAESAIGCLMAARYVAQSNQVRVAIVDRGLGIHTTLKRRYAEVNPTLALRWVTQGDYSALSRANNLGLGISNLCAIVKNMAGSIFILSEEGAAERRAGGDWSVRLLPCRFQGTGVFFDLSMRE